MLVIPINLVAMHKQEFDSLKLSSDATEQCELQVDPVIKQKIIDFAFEQGLTILSDFLKRYNLQDNELLVLQVARMHHAAHFMQKHPRSQ